MQYWEVAESRIGHLLANKKPITSDPFIIVGQAIRLFMEEKNCSMGCMMTDCGLGKCPNRIRSKYSVRPQTALLIGDDAPSIENMRINMNPAIKNKLIPAVVAVLIATVVAWFVWTKTLPSGYGESFVSGNGRIEAIEIDIAAKYGGRVVDIFTREGDFVYRLAKS